MKKKKLWVQGFVTAWNHARLGIPPLYLVSERTSCDPESFGFDTSTRSLSFLCDMTSNSLVQFIFVRNMNAIPLQRCELRFPWTGGWISPSIMAKAEGVGFTLLRGLEEEEGSRWDAEAACLAPSADAGGHPPPQPPSACRRYRWRDLLPGGTAASLIDNTKCSLQCIFAEAV